MNEPMGHAARARRNDLTTTMRTRQTGLRKLGQMPMVRRAADKDGRNYHALLMRYEALPKRPLKIEVRVAGETILGVDGAIHFDALLTHAVTEDFSEPTLHLPGSDTSVIPLPLELLWVSPEGRPLYAASDLLPEGEWVRGTRYWHKRYPMDRAEFATQPNALTTAGRWKDARIPLGTRVPGDGALLRGLAIGNRDEVERLLTGYIAYLGRKTAHGLGRVTSWSICEFDDDPEMVRALLLDRRPVPIDYYIERGSMEIQDPELRRRLVPRRGWTAPYWYAPLHATCVMPPA